MSVIDSFLVGIGFDVDEQSERNAESSIDKVRSGFVAAGAAIGVAMTGVSVAINRNAEDLDHLAKQTRLLSNATVQQVDIMTHVMESLGGDINDVFGYYGNLQDLIAKSKIGELDYEGFAKAGIDIKSLISSSKSLEELNLKLIKAYGQLGKDQKILARDVLGLTDAQALLFESGIAGYKEMADRARELGVVSDQAAQAGENITQAWSDFGRSAGSILDVITEKVGDDLAGGINFATEKLIDFRKLLEGIEITKINAETGESEITGEAISSAGILTAAAGVGATVLGGILLGSTLIPGIGQLAAPVTVPLGSSLVSGGIGTAAVGLGITAAGGVKSGYDEYNQTYVPEVGGTPVVVVPNTGSQNINITSPITINESANPEATAAAVSRELNNVARDIGLNNKGSIDR